MPLTKIRRITILLLLTGLSINQLVAASLTPRGWAVYSELSEDLFVMSFSIDSSLIFKSDMVAQEGRRQLEFKFLTNLSKRQFLNIIKQNAAINNPPGVLERNVGPLGTFSQMLEGPFVKGDHLTLTALNNFSFDVELNQVTLGTVKSKELFNAILNVWMGPVPPSRKFKQALLGQIPSDDDRLLFRSIVPSKTRHAEIKTWSSANPIANLRKQPDQNPTNLKRVKIQQDFALELMQHARKHIVYPRKALNNKQGGEVMALITINKNGEITKFSLENKAQFTALNDAVDEGIRSSNPFPKIPAELAKDSFSFYIPISFSAENH